MQPERREVQSRIAERSLTRFCFHTLRLWQYAVNLRRTTRRIIQAGCRHIAFAMREQIPLAGESRQASGEKAGRDIWTQNYSTSSWIVQT